LLCTTIKGVTRSPNVTGALSLARGQGVDLSMEQASFFLGRERLIVDPEIHMSRWRANLFVFLSRNAYDASAFFEIPDDQIISVGIRLSV